MCKKRDNPGLPVQINTTHKFPINLLKTTEEETEGFMDAEKKERNRGRIDKAWERRRERERETTVAKRDRKSSGCKRCQER